MKNKGIGAAAFVVNEAGEILLVRHTYGHLNWELPGGGAESDESPAETALRELREETGLSAAARHMTGCYYTTENDAVHFVFWCEPQDRTAIPKPNCAEISKCGYWPPDALPRPISDWTMRRIQDALNGNKFGLPAPIGARIWLE